MRHKKYYWGLAILITLLLDTACILFLLHKSAPEEAFNLFEAFFRYQFIYNECFYTPEANESYFLEIEGQNPPANFMARFAGHSPRVKKGSDFVLDDLGVKRRDGILFRIDSWKWIGLGWLTRDHAEICGECDLSSSGAGTIYIWKRDKKGWALAGMGHTLVWDGPPMTPKPKNVTNDQSGK